MSRLRRLAREGVVVASGQFLNVLGALFLVKVVTGNLEPDQYGHITLALTFVTLIHQIIMGGTLNSIGRYYPIAVEAGETSPFVSASRLMMTINIALVTAISVPVIFSIYKTGNEYLASLTAAAAMLAIFNGVNGAINSVQNAARNRVIVAYHLALDAWLKIVLVLLAVWLLGESSVYVLGSYVIAAALVLLSQVLLLRKLHLSFTTTRHKIAEWTKKMSRYSWPFVAWGGFTWAHFASDRWSLQFFAGSTEVGLYSVVYQLGFVPIGIATNIAANFFGPILNQLSGDAKDERRVQFVQKISRSMTHLCLLITAISVTLAYVLHQWVFSFMVSEEYRSVSYLLPPMVLAGGMFAAGELIALKLMAELRVSAMISTKVLTSVLGFLLNMAGAISFGVIGVVIAQVSYSGLYLVSMLCLVRGRSIKTYSAKSEEVK